MGRIAKVDAVIKDFADKLFDHWVLGYLYMMCRVLGHIITAVIDAIATAISIMDALDSMDTCLNLKDNRIKKAFEVLSFR